MSTVPPTMATAVSLADVRADVDGRTILHIDALTIGVGERVAVIGSNGAGKSTLLQVLSGFRKPGTGHVEVLGRRLDGDLDAKALRALRCEIGQVFQGIHLVSRLTSLENVAIGALGRTRRRRDIAASWLRIWPGAMVDQARAALATVGLLPMADVAVARLSGGERQKVAIARMLMQRPRLILADEPTANLDPDAARRFGAWLPRDDGTTTISVVHTPALIESLATRVIALREGCVVFDGPLARLDAQQLEQAYAPPRSR